DSGPTRRRPEMPGDLDPRWPSGIVEGNSGTLVSRSLFVPSPDLAPPPGSRGEGSVEAMNNRMISRRRAKPYSFRALLATLIGVWICGGAVMLWACNVPVFRYAMAYWEPDPFRVVLLHRGPLAEEVRVEVTELQHAARDSDRPANLELILVDLD